jgi:hypothetical protein
MRTHRRLAREDGKGGVAHGEVMWCAMMCYFAISRHHQITVRAKANARGMWDKMASMRDNKDDERRMRNDIIPRHVFK